MSGRTAVGAVGRHQESAALYGHDPASWRPPAGLAARQRRVHVGAAVARSFRGRRSGRCGRGRRGARPAIAAWRHGGFRRRDPAAAPDRVGGWTWGRGCSQRRWRRRRLQPRAVALDVGPRCRRRRRGSCDLCGTVHRPSRRTGIDAPRTRHRERCPCCEHACHGHRRRRRRGAPSNGPGPDQRCCGSPPGAPPPPRQQFSAVCRARPDVEVRPRKCCGWRGVENERSSTGSTFLPSPRAQLGCGDGRSRARGGISGHVDRAASGSDDFVGHVASEPGHGEPAGIG